MFGFFKKKKSSVEEYLINVVEKPNLDFQLDFFRNRDVDFQIIRQRMIKGFDASIKINNPEGFSIMISFDPNTDEGLSRHNKFKTSKIHSQFKEIENIDETYKFYFMQCKNDIKAILDFVHRVQTEIYDYKHDTYYYFKYKEI